MNVRNVMLWCDTGAVSFGTSSELTDGRVPGWPYPDANDTRRPTVGEEWP